MARKMGRKPKDTPELRERLGQALRIGASRNVACSYAGISHTTFYEWMHAKPDFAAFVKASEDTGTITWLQVIEDAAKAGQWQAAAWKLERLYPERYARRSIVNASVDATIAAKAYIVISPDDWDSDDKLDTTSPAALPLGSDVIDAVIEIDDVAGDVADDAA